MNVLPGLFTSTSQKIGILRRLRNFMSNAALLKIYGTVVFPHFNYCCTVWCAAKNKTFIDRLLRLHKRAGRIIFNPDFYYGYFTQS